MAINPKNPKHLNRLRQAITHSRHALSGFRDLRTRLISQYVGPNYVNGETAHARRRKKYVNYLNQTAETFTTALVANRPRVSITSRYKELKFFARKFQIHTNHLIEEIRLEETLRSIVLDAFFGMGIGRVFLGSTGNRVEIPANLLEGPEAYHGNPLNPLTESVWVDPGAPMFERISLDDWFHDNSALRWDQCKFMGNYFRIAFDKLKDPLFDQSIASKLSPTSRDEGADDPTGFRASDLSDDHESFDEVMDFIDLMDIWLPYEKLIVTMPRSGGSWDKPLAVREWDGPETGPYHILGFQEVPDNLMPSAPAYNIIDLDVLWNIIFRKVEQQAIRQKNLVIAPNDSKESMEAVRRARDGEGIIYSDNAESIRQASYGGLDQTNLAFSIQVAELFNKAAGNPEALAGLGPQSGTATQDQMILDSVSQKFSKMSERVVNFTTRVCRDLGWLLWVDAYKRQPGQFEIPGAGITIQSDWTPDDREGDFVQYLFTVEPYSMQYRSPQQRAMQLRELVQNIYLPALPFIQQAGGQIDWQALNNEFSDQYDLPALKDILKFNSPPMEPEVGTQDAMKDPARASNAPREYIRRSVSTGGTQESRNNVMMQTLLAGDNAPISPQQMQANV